MLCAVCSFILFIGSQINFNSLRQSEINFSIEEKITTKKIQRKLILIRFVRLCCVMNYRSRPKNRELICYTLDR